MSILFRSQQIAALQKAEGQPAKVTVRKGMYEVSRLSSLISDLHALQSTVAYESQREGDGSNQHAELKGCLETMISCLKSMVEEETQELLDSAIPDGAYVGPY